MHRKQMRFLSALCLILAFALGGCQKESKEEKLQLSEVKTTEETNEEVTEKETEDKEAADIYVHVCGQVQSPGVYQLKGGSRIFEALEAAGGLLETADADGLNQAEEAADGQQVYVPAQGEQVVLQGAVTEGEQQIQDGKVNINTATKEELMTLNGIGEARAVAVIRYREEHGSFQAVEELKQIEGIKDGIFNRIKDQVKVS